MSGKLTKLMEWLRQERIDAAFITSPDNVFYIGSMSNVGVK
ncbi:Xaa-Pro aminopeptidase [Bacillus thermophilus]|uniref:Xaa-Pro aminopeptidase n=1 Tax=Siminovitchia thermophila TaxID=1245522 RepID=A0ABS2R5B0_9BACI|nr:aminopeptidase P family N-terminal domain-containing protein [Siminovitchia thermophila]MBM7714828.1 Xaa-Pro aminopeptidase [Siminovitchia thermophila]